jgi:hypothetical protein
MLSTAGQQLYKAKHWQPKQRHNRLPLFCIKQSIFQQQYTRHNAVKCTDMEIANVVLLCHGRASCRELMQVVRKPQTNGENE